MSISSMTGSSHILLAATEPANYDHKYTNKVLCLPPINVVLFCFFLWLFNVFFTRNWTSRSSIPEGQVGQLLSPLQRSTTCLCGKKFIKTWKMSEKLFPKNFVSISLSKLIAVVLRCMVCPCPVNPVLANTFHLELDAGWFILTSSLTMWKA